MMMMMNYEMQLTAAASHVADKMLACSRISQSKSITYLLQMTLDLGNFLNYGAPPTRALAGAAAGRLASSPRMGNQGRSLPMSDGCEIRAGTRNGNAGGLVLDSLLALRDTKATGKKGAHAVTGARYSFACVGTAI